MTQQRRVVIVHGAYGSPQENWFPWLKDQLEAKHYSVTVPAFPTPEGQSPEAWMQVLDRDVPEFDDRLIMVGHSAGPLLILRKLELLRRPVKAVFLVSSFVRDLGLPEFDTLNRPFYERPFDWATIKRNAGRAFVYHSDNDPYVPLEFGQEVARNLGVKLEVLHNAGHINAAAGYTHFDRLCKDLVSVK